MSRLSLLVLLALAACASPTRPSLADKLLEHGDHDAAVMAYARALSETPEDADLAEKYETARRIAAQAHREEAEAARSRGDLDRVARELRRVMELAPDDAASGAQLRRIEGARARVQKAVDAAVARLEAGDAEGARRILDPHLADLGPFPDGVRALRTADTRIRESALGEAQAALGRHDFSAARDAARRAADVAPTSPRSTELLERAEAGLEAVKITKTAEAARGHGDYRKAISDFSRALELVPGLEPALVGLGAAKTDGARANLEAARRSLAAGKLAEARERLRTADDLVPGGTESNLAPLDGEVRGAIRAKMIEEGGRHKDFGRPALAHLYYREAEALNPWRAELEDEVARTWVEVIKALRVVVRIEDLKNAGGARLDELGITRSVVGHLLAGGLPPWLQVQPRDGQYEKPDIIVSGRIETFGTSFSKPVARTEKVRYVRETTTRANPEHTRIAKRLRAARTEVADMEADLASERKKLAHLVDYPWNSIRNRRYRDNPDRVEGAYQTALSVQRSRIRTAERNLERAAAAAEEIRLALSRTPPILERQVHAEGRYRVITRRVTGQARISLKMVDGRDRIDMFDALAVANIDHEDTETAGFEPAGIAADPNELPTGEAARDRLTTAMVVSVSRKVRDVLETLAKRHLESGEAADATARLEAKALFLLCGVPGSGETRADAEKALREATGITVAPLPEAGGEARK